MEVGSEPEVSRQDSTQSSAVNVGEGEGTAIARVAEGGVGGFREELHGVCPKTSRISKLNGPFC
jgi:hypothetical protein